MIKQGIINFFLSLKYFFTSLGTIALSLIFGLSIFIPGIISSISTLANDIQTILSDTSIDLAALKGSLLSAVQELNWEDPFNALRTMASNHWLMQTLNECVNSLVESTEVYTTQFSTVINSFTHDLVAYFSVVIVFLFFGIGCGFFLIKWLIRRNMAKRTLWKYLLNSFIDSFLSATLVSVCLWLLSIWQPSIFITTFVSIVLFGFISLLESYIVHAWKKVDIKKVVNAKNIFQLFLTNVIIFILAMVFVLLTMFLTNLITGLFIGFVLMEIAFIVIGLNAEAYTKSFVKD